MNVKLFWNRLFGFQVGDIVRYNRYPKHLWEVMESNTEWVIIKRITRTKRLIPYRVNFCRRFHQQGILCLEKVIQDEHRSLEN